MLLALVLGSVAAFAGEGKNARKTRSTNANTATTASTATTTQGAWSNNGQADECRGLRAEVERLRHELRRAHERIAELENQLNQAGQFSTVPNDAASAVGSNVATTVIPNDGSIRQK
jgi:predicted RNase H-like nuclease (RuvC/YqgF family)